MKISKLDDMVRGWFVGNFVPSVLQTEQIEVGVQRYKKGDTEERHYHKIATEITVIVEGSARMGGQNLSVGDIVVLEPGEDTDFEAMTDVVTVAVKYPSAKGDKYLGTQHG